MPQGKKKLLLVMDFDGTLAPIKSAPSKAALSNKTRNSLKKLAACPRIRLAVFSGRPLREIINLVSVKRVYYSGNHGIEIKGPGMSFCHPEADDKKTFIDAASAEAEKLFKPVKGTVIERKKFTLSLHYRMVSKTDMPAFRTAARHLKEFSRGFPVSWKKGKKVIEAVPDISWDKGKALSHLMKELGFPYPVVLGDDRTDEDMFKIVKKRGMGIRIGFRKSSSAAYYLEGQRRIDDFLGYIREKLSGAKRIKKDYAESQGTIQILYV